jgi:hypothetical protein
MSDVALRLSLSKPAPILDAPFDKLRVSASLMVARA